MASKFEQAVARILYSASEKQGLAQSNMGSLAFAGEASPDRKIRSLFDSEKARSLKVSEMFAWAKGVGLDPARVVSKALDIVEGSEAMPDISVSDRPGRKPRGKLDPREAA